MRYDRKILEPTLLDGVEFATRPQIFRPLEEEVFLKKFPKLAGRVRAFNSDCLAINRGIAHISRETHAIDRETHIEEKIEILENCGKKLLEIEDKFFYFLVKSQGLAMDVSEKPKILGAIRSKFPPEQKNSWREKFEKMCKKLAEKKWTKKWKKKWTKNGEKKWEKIQGNSEKSAWQRAQEIKHGNCDFRQNFVENAGNFDWNFGEFSEDFREIYEKIQDACWDLSEIFDFYFAKFSMFLTKSIFVDYKKFPKLAWRKRNDRPTYDRIRKIASEEEKQKIIQIGARVEEVFAEFLGKKFGEVKNLAESLEIAGNPRADSDEEDDDWGERAVQQRSPAQLRENAARTLAAMRAGVPVFFQPGFLWGDCYVRADFMVRAGDGRYDLIEVKAKTSVRKPVRHEGEEFAEGEFLDELVWDVSFQKFVIEQALAELGQDAGLALGKIFIGHLNKNYLLDGALEIEKLLCLAELGQPDEVVLPGVEKADKIVARKNQLLPAASVAALLDKMRAELPLSQQEFNKIHPFPGNKYLEWFGRDKLEDGKFGTVLAIPKLHRSKSALVAQLVEEGREKLEDLRENDIEKLGESAGEFVNFYLESQNRGGEPLVRAGEIAAKLGNLKFPIGFYDYETVSVPVPFLQQTRPYQQVVVQYSLHKVWEDGRMEHFGGLLVAEEGEPAVERIVIDENPNACPQESEKVVRGNRRKLCEEFLRDAAGCQSFVVWYEPFENSRNKEIWEIFPDLADDFLAINEKTFDLMKIFSEKLWFDPAFRGSSSIKKVLPVLVPGMQYEGLAVKNGAVAMQRLQELLGGELGEEARAVAEDLLCYCGQDSLAMVRIREKIREKIGGK